MRTKAAVSLTMKQEGGDTPRVLQRENLHPASDCQPHPLSLWDTAVGKPLVVKANQQRWLVYPDQIPNIASDLAIPKQSIFLDYDFSGHDDSEAAITTEKPNSHSSTPEVSPADQRSSSQEKIAIDRTPSTKEPAFSIPFIQPAPPLLAETVTSNLSKTGKEWTIDRLGAKFTQEQWQTVSTKGRQKEQATAVEAKPDITKAPEAVEIQGVLTEYLQSVVKTGSTPRDLTSEQIPCLTNLIQRANSEVLFQSDKLSTVTEDIQFLADALNLPVHFTWNHISHFICQPGYATPTKYTESEAIESATIHLLRADARKPDHWFASIEHYFQWSDEQEEIVAKKENIISRKKSRRTS